MRRQTRAVAAGALWIALLPSSALGQLVLDSTFESQGVAPGPITPVNNVYEVGDAQGVFSANHENRYHSFSQFDLLSSSLTALFTSLETPERVIVRVTQATSLGGSVINGTLRSTIPGADLYFLNPFGISFGSATLDVQGSFYASTADVLRFTGGVDFPSTGALPAPVTLSAAAPSAFGFTSSAPSPIEVVRARSLAVPPGETLSFVAGSFDMTSRSSIAANVLAPGATVQIGAASGPVDLPVDLASLDPQSLPPPPGDDVSPGSIELRSSAAIDVSSPLGGGVAAGQIVIRGGRFHLDNARLEAVNRDALDAAGGIDVGVNGAIELTSGALVSSAGEAAGAAGGLSFTASHINVEGSRVTSEARGIGDGGAIEIDAASLRIANQSERSEGSFVASVAGEGQGGDLTVRAAQIELAHGGQLRADTVGTGDAGALRVLGGDVVHLDGIDGSGRPTAITARALETATGNGGDLVIETRVLEVENGALVSAATFGAGSAGDLAISASERVAIRGGSDGAALVSAASRLSGASGDLTISAPSVVLADGGQITVSTDGASDAGDLLIQAGDVSISGRDAIGNQSGLFAQSNSRAPDGGDGGDITVLATGDITVADDGRVSVQTFGGGDAGNILLDAGGAIRVAGGTVGSISNSTGAGREVKLVGARGISITDGGLISARANSTGNAGFITIDAGPRLEIVDSSITTEASNASGGRVDVRAREAIVLQRSRITTSVLNGFGGGGDMAIDPVFLILSHSELRANAFEGPGGNIGIRAGTFLATPDSVVDASSQLGIDGNVVIDSPNTELTGKLAALPQGFLNASELLGDACLARTTAEGSFVVRPRAPQPPPDALLSPTSGADACAAPEGM